jgi:hypothetical protein
MRRVFQSLDRPSASWPWWGARGMSRALLKLKRRRVGLLKRRRSANQSGSASDLVL